MIVYPWIDELMFYFRLRGSAIIVNFWILYDVNEAMVLFFLMPKVMKI
jgi:hypothetical protein